MKIRTKKSIYQRKRRLCGTVLYGFRRRRQADKGIYGQAVYPVQGCLLEVVREQYADFYRDRERWRYLQKLDARNSLLSLDGFTDSEGILWTLSLMKRRTLRKPLSMLLWWTG